MKYIYLDREKAKQGVALVFMMSDEKKTDFKSYFRGEAVEFVGNDLPHFITYVEETDTVREASEEEKLQNGHRELYSNEVLIDGKIVTYDTATQKIVDNKVVEKTREDFILEGCITVESEKEKARKERDKAFLSLDLYDKAVLRGDIEESEEEKSGRDEYRQAWLDITNYEDLSIDISSTYPETPEKIKYF